jgi:hypothetical protein
MRRKGFKKPLALIVALAMILTTLGGFGAVSFAAEKQVKFSVEISSKASDGTTGVVKSEVYSDFSGKLTVTGTKVNSSNAKIKVTMTDVDSLGVQGTRTYTRDMSFDSNQDVPLTTVTNLFDKLNNTSVNLSYGDESVGYTVSGADGTYALEPSSEDDARAVWHAIVNEDNFEYGQKDKEDSYVVIGNGSWLHIGNSVLKFEDDYTEDLVLDNFGDLSTLNQNIRDAVVLDQDEETVEGVSFNLAAGTELALGSSYAKLKNNAAFDFEVEDYAKLEECLATLRDEMGGSTTNMMKTLFGVMDSVFTTIGGTSIEAQGQIGEVPDQPTNKDDSDKQDLSNAVKEAISILGSGTFTSDSYKAAIAAINEANAVIENEEATQEDIDVAAVKLDAAVRQLVATDKAAEAATAAAEAAAAAKVDAIDDLAQTLIKAISLNTSKYRKSTVDKFKAAINAGKTVLANDDAALDELRSAKRDIVRAQVFLTVKGAQKITVKAAKKNVKVKKVKKAKQTVKAITVKGAKGKITYKKLSGSKKLTVNAKNGKITVKKKTKKGVYKAKVKVTAAATGELKAATRTVTVNIRVK